MHSIEHQTARNVGLEIIMLTSILDDAKRNWSADARKIDRSEITEAVILCLTA